jgi:hypothetical protein
MSNITISGHWRLVPLLIVISSMVSPFISTFYRGYVGLVPLLLVSLVLLFPSSAGIYFYKTGSRVLEANKGMFFCLLWFIVGNMLLFIRGGDDFGYFISVLILPVCLFSGMFLTKQPYYKSFAVIGVLVFLVMNNIFAGESIGQAESARNLLKGQEGGNSLAGTSSFWGLIGTFIPIFVAEVIKQKKWIIKLILSAALAFLIYKLLFCGFATPIGIFILNIAFVSILSLRRNQTNSSSYLKSLIITFLVLFFTFLLLNAILNTTNVAQADVQYRFINFINNPLGGGYKGNDGVSRFILMDFSWQTFLQKPFFGGGGNIRTSIYEGVAGGHSSAIDSLAVLGLFGGGGAFLCFVYLACKNAYMHMKRENSFYSLCNFSVVVSFIIGGILNPYWAGPLLICIIFMTTIYSYRSIP